MAVNLEQEVKRLNKKHIRLLGIAEEYKVEIYKQRDKIVELKKRNELFEIHTRKRFEIALAKHEAKAIGKMLNETYRNGPPFDDEYILVSDIEEYIEQLLEKPQ